MNKYFEHSFHAYKLLNEVLQTLHIDESPEESVLNGNASRIISLCAKSIDEQFTEKKSRELLKYYVARSYFENYNLEIEEDFTDQIIN